eukprot:3365810-Alexandrium_andersonii.AAC.1
MPCGLVVHENLKRRLQFRRATTPTLRPSGGGLGSDARGAGLLAHRCLVGPWQKRPEIICGPGRP